jgi:predicted transposase YbfD/YdcC
VFDAAGAFADTEWSALLSAVIRVERDVLTRSASTGLWRRSTETACYLSSAAITAARAASAIRDHWKIENTSHYSRDVTMGEDRSRIRINPGVFARLRSFAFNILKANRRGSLNQDRYRAAIGGLERLINLLRIPQR